ncbi:MAG: hypothetical protein A3G34_08710 [Candidatus Lindowbacteria bacterium RIFCSPLOWO2_12_FULL_62_27]|nr:MAG: hypothetical protein A3G34_08710 [Candidatus Lindowbacteria bacterium RIFCSPLOWO2_12_FULL_62_27]
MTTGQIGILALDKDDTVSVLMLAYNPDGDSSTKWESDNHGAFDDVRKALSGSSRSTGMRVKITREHFYLQDFCSRQTRALACRGRSFALGLGLCARAVQLGVDMSRVICTGNVNADGNVLRVDGLESKLRSFGLHDSFDMVLVPAEQKPETEDLVRRNGITEALFNKIKYVNTLGEAFAECGLPTPTTRSPRVLATLLVTIILSLFLATALYRWFQHNKRGSANEIRSVQKTSDTSARASTESNWLKPASTKLIDLGNIPEFAGQQITPEPLNLKDGKVIEWREQKMSFTLPKTWEQVLFADDEMRWEDRRAPVIGSGDGIYLQVVTHRGEIDIQKHIGVKAKELFEQFLNGDIRSYTLLPIDGVVGILWIDPNISDGTPIYLSTDTYNYGSVSLYDHEYCSIYWVGVKPFQGGARTMAITCQAVYTRYPLASPTLLAIIRSVKFQSK